MTLKDEHFVRRKEKKKQAMEFERVQGCILPRKINTLGLSETKNNFKKY